MRYKVTYRQTETFYMFVEADDKQSADDKAAEMFSSGEYNDNGDCQVESVSVEEIK